MSREVLLGFSGGLDNRGIFARERSSPTSALGQSAESFEVPDGALNARKGDLELIPACYIQGEGPYLVRFYGQQLIPQQVLESEGRLLATLGPFLCGALVNSESGQPPTNRFHVYPIYRRRAPAEDPLSRKTYETIARVGDGIYIVPSSPETTSVLDKPLRWDGRWYMANATRVVSGALYAAFPPPTYSVWLVSPTASFLRNVPLTPGMTCFFGRRKTTVTPKEVDWLVEPGRDLVTLRGVWRPNSGDPFYIITDYIAPPADSGANGDFNTLGFSDCSEVGLRDYSTQSPGGGYVFSLALSAGGTWPANVDIEYCWTFAHAGRGIEGLPSRPQAVNTGSSGGQKVTVSINVAPLYRPPGTDRVRVWRRSRSPGEQWTDWQLIYSHTLLTTTQQTYGGEPGQLVWEAPSFTVVDSPLPSLGLLPGDAFFRQPPPYLSRVVSFNGRLFGVGAGKEVNRLYFSTIGEPEYWPRDVAGILGYVADTKWLGGYVTVGGPTPITAMVPESGAYTTTGTSGDNLLVFKASEAYRLFGMNWSDFSLQFAFSSGCPYPFTLHNCGGYIIWRSRDHVLGVPAGGTTPDTLSLPLWPLGRQGREDGQAAVEPVAVYAKGCYILKDLDTSVYDFDLGTRNWSPGRRDIVWMAALPSGFGIFALPGSVLQIHTGRVGDVPAPYAYAASLREEKAGQVQAMKFNTPPVPSPNSADVLPRKKRLRRIWVSYACGPGPLTLTVKVAGAEQQSPATIVKTLPATGANVQAIGQIVPIELSEPMVSHAFQLAFTVEPGDPPAQYARVFWVALDYEELLTKV